MTEGDTGNQLAATAERLGSYTIRRTLGTGGMGRVLLAEAPGGQRVALKTIRDDLADDPEVRMRFLREARAAARLNHPNIVRLLDFGELGGTYFMAMEYVSGGTLTEWRRSPPAGDVLIDVFGQILDAVAYAHARGVVHRDLKPDNVLLHPAAGGRFEARVMDFGVAHFRDEFQTEPGMDTVMVGTPAYMAPEQALRPSDVTPSADLYAVGIMLYEIIAGRLPFIGKSAMGTVMAHMRQPIPELAARGEYRLQGPFDDLMRRFLAKEPWDRFLLGADARRALSRCAVERVGQRREPTPAGGVISGAFRRRDTDATISSRPVHAVRSYGVFGLAEPPLVGREREVATLWSRASDALEAGQREAILLPGPPGVGKTRLVAAMKERLEETGRMTSWIARFESGRSALDVLRSALRRGIGVDRLAPDEVAHRVSEWTRRGGATDPWETETLISFLLGAREEGRSKLPPGEEARWAVIDRAIRRAQAVRPVLFVLEDVHESNGAPFRLLDWLLSGRPQGATWFAVATYRPDIVEESPALSEALAELQRNTERRNLSVVPVEPLPVDDMAKLLRTCAPLPPAAVQTIADRAEGLPFVAIELVRHIAKKAELGAATGPLDAVELLSDLPREVDDLLRRRLEEAARAPDDDIDVLEIWERLAFLGNTVPIELGRVLLEQEEISDAAARLDTALSTGLVANVFVEDLRGSLRFESGVLRESLLERARDAHRFAYRHSAAAQAKEAYYGSDRVDHAVEIAQHYVAAGDSDRALGYFLLAARGAMDESRYLAAYSAFSRAEHIARGTDVAERAPILLSLADAAVRLGDYEGAEEWIRRARDHEEDEASKVHIDAIRLLAEVAQRAGTTEESRELYIQALGEYERRDDRAGIAQARFGLGQLELRDGNMEIAERLFRGAREAYEAVGDRRGEASALWALGRTAFNCGLFEEADGFTRKARYRHGLIGNRHGAAICLITLGEIALARADAAQAERYFDEAKEELLSVGDRFHAALALLHLGQAALQRARPERAEQCVRSALDSFVTINDESMAAIARLRLAGALLSVDRWAAADQEIDRALAHDASQPVENPLFTDALVDLARDALFSGHSDRARELLERAIPKLERIAVASPLYDRVDEARYLLHELGDD